MKCLSLWQPWATLVAIGAKTIETRSWSTKYRGELLIHASKRWSMAEVMLCYQPHFLAALRRNEADANGMMEKRLSDACGHILGSVRLVDCFTTDDIPEKYAPLLTERERAFGNFGPGRFGWVLQDAKPLAAPIPFTGRQGLFNVPASLVKGMS